jgi:SpoVK/Ycf46/Vps4 family AAA+-type ATPase
MSEVELLLRTDASLASELDKAEAYASGGNAEPYTSDRCYLAAAELRLLVRCLSLHALGALRVSLVGGRAMSGATIQPDDGPTTLCAPAHLANRVSELQKLLVRLETFDERRLVEVGPDGWKPRIVRVSAAYQFSPCEVSAFLLLILMQQHTSSVWDVVFEDVPNEEVGTADAHVLRDVCGLSAVQVGRFFEEERLHIKEGIVHVKEDEFTPGKKTASMMNEAVEVLTCGLDHHALLPSAGAAGADGATTEAATAAHKEKLALKLSGTTLLSTLQAECGGTSACAPIADAAAAPQESSHSAPGGNDGAGNGGAVGRLLQALDGQAAEELAAELQAATGAAEVAAAMLGRAPESQLEAPLEEEARSLARGGHETVSDESGEAAARGVAPDGDAPSRGYDSELEYLDDQFSALVQRIQLSAELAKQRVKHAEVEEQRTWESRPSRKVNTAELQAKVRLIEGRIALRLGRAGKLGKPRLEGLCDQLHLDAFEKSVLLIACGNTISPVVKQLLAQTSAGRSFDADELTVGRILQVLTSTFHEQVEKRVYFYRSATLVKKGLVRLQAKSYSRGTDDLTDLRVLLDRRVLDCLVGLDRESEEVAGESTNLYTPAVDLSAVVLPEAVRERLLALLSSTSALRTYSRRVHLADAIPQPEGQVLLLCGPSGSGKTMTANAIARMLGKKVLLVNFPLLRAERGISPQSILREAELANAIVFFDECESLFASRGAGGSAEMTELLTEIERFEGLIFLATNRPQDLDEAMYRRLTAVFELPAPNHKQRARIWAALTASDAVPLCESVDLEEVALKYELTGGFIRNAVLAALMRAVGRDGVAPRVTQADLHDGCRDQMRGSLQLASGGLDGGGTGQGGAFSSAQGFARPLDALVLPGALHTSLHSILALEKARPVLASEWGFAEAFSRRGGVTALFWGPPGSGKRSGAAALAFELGRPVRVVHFAAMLSGASGGGGGRERGAASGSALQTVFKDARLADALVLVSGVDPRSESLERDERALQLLLHETERYPGVVIYCCAAAESLDAAVHAVHPALLRAMKQVVEFRLPDTKTRERLWRALVPPACPLVDFDPTALARESEGFGASRIQACIWKAAGVAAMVGVEEAAKPRRPAVESPVAAAPATREDAAPTPSSGTEAHATASVRQSELLRAVKEEHAKEEGRQSRLVHSMMM